LNRILNSPTDISFLLNCILNCLAQTVTEHSFFYDNAITDDLQDTKIINLTNHRYKN